MSLIMLVLLLLFLHNAKTAKFNQYMADYCSASKTSALKGVFVMMVFISHFRTYITTTEADTLAITVVNYLGQLMVAPFLFYSGFGVAESIKKKGTAYVRKLPTHRALKTLLHFDIAVCLFVILSWAMGGPVTLKTFLLSMICWESFGNSTWYIFAIVCMYLLTAAAFSIFRKNHYAAAAATTIFSIILIGVLQNYREVHWYDTMLCYSAGIWYSYLKRYVDKFVMRNDLLYGTVLLGISFVFYCLYTHCINAWLYNLCAIAFVLVILCISMKLSLESPFLKFLGKHIFSLYILQRLPMIILSEIEFFANHTVLLCVICLAITCVFAIIFDKAMQQLDTRLFKETPKK